MKKVLIFHPYLAPYRLDFFNSIKNKFSEVMVYFKYPNDYNQNFDIDVLRSEAKFNFDYILNGFRLLNRDIRFGAFKKIIQYDPEIIITHEYSSFSIRGFLYKILKGEKVKWFITTDDSVEILNRLPLYRKLAMQLLIPKIDGLITISEDSGNWHKNKRTRLKDKIYVLPIIRSEIEFRNKLDQALPISEKYMREYGLQNKKVILYVGRLAQVKGVDRLIDVFLTIPDKDLVLLIVGDGPLKEKIQEKVSLAQDKRIILTGRFDGQNLVAWYNVASFFVLLSHHEPFGAVVNEALLSGLKVVCSGHAGASCLITENKNGIIVDPFDNDLIRTSILKLCGEVPEINQWQPKIKANLMPVYFESQMDGLEHFLLK